VTTKPRWTDKLARTVRDTVDDLTIKTRSDARSYIIHLRPSRAQSAQWQNVMRLLFAGADAEAVTRAVELALMYEARLDLKSPK
jgi:hypothetical protein